MCLPGISSSRANLSVVGSRLESLLHVKLLRSCKNVFQTVCFVQREIIINIILETVSQEGRNMNIANEEKRSSLLLLAIVQPSSLMKSRTLRNDCSYKCGELSCIMFGSKVLCFGRLL